MNFSDYLILQNSFGQSLPDLPEMAGGVVVGNTTAHALDIGWTAADAQPRDGFKIYRSDDGGATYSLIQTLAEPDARAWRDEGTNDDLGTPLITGHKYWYRVRPFTLDEGASASITRASGIPTDTSVESAFSASVDPSTVAPNELFTLTLSATAAAAPGVTAWKITWQNGQTQTVTGGPNASNSVKSDWLVPKSFSTPGQHFILVQAQDAGGWHDPIGVTVNVTNTAPTVSGTDSYTTSGTSVSLSVTGTDDGGASNLTYRWTVEESPTGGTVSFAPPSGQSANHTTATFNQAGDYFLSVIATDRLGLASDPFSVTVNVQAAPQYVGLFPHSVSLKLGDTKQFNAAAYDQFDAPIDGFAVSWSATHGTIDANGLYTATGASSAGTDTVRVYLPGDPDNYDEATVNVQFPAPSGLSANAPNESEVNLSWADNSNGETGFNILMSTDGTTFTPGITAAVNATGWSVVGLHSDKQYWFKVQAIAGGLSSNVSNVTTIKTKKPGETDEPKLEWSEDGPFYHGKEHTTLTVSNLKQGKHYTISLDPGFSGYSWDGDSQDFGPDNMKVTHNGQTLVDGTYSYWSGWNTEDDLNNLSLEITASGSDEVFDFTSSLTVANISGYEEYFEEPWRDESWTPSATVTLNDSLPPTPSVSIKNADDEVSAEAWEVPLGDDQDDTLKFTVTRTGNDEDGDLDQPLTVKLHPPAGLAKSGEDYTGFQGTVTIPAHENSADFTFTAKSDGSAEFDEAVALCLKADQTYRLGTLEAQGIIHNSPTLISISAQGGELHEGQSKAKGDPDKAGFWIRRPTSSSSDSTLTVNLQFGGNATIGKDVWGVPKQVDIPSGKSEVFVPIGITEDILPEWTELFQVKLAPSTAYRVGDNAKDYVSWKILDDDYFYVGTYEAPETTVKLSTVSTSDAGVTSAIEEDVSLEAVGYEFNAVVSLADEDWIPWLTGEETANGDPATKLYDGAVDAEPTDDETWGDDGDDEESLLYNTAAVEVDPMVHARNLSILEELKPGFNFTVSSDGTHYLGTDAAGRTSRFDLDLTEVAYKGTHQGFYLKFNDDGSIDKWGGEFVNDPKLIERVRKPYQELQRELSLRRDKYFQQYNEQTEEHRIIREQFDAFRETVAALLQAATSAAPGATTLDIETAVTGEGPFNPGVLVSGGSRALSAASASLPIVGIVSHGKKLLTAAEQLRQNWLAGMNFVTLRSGKVYKTIPDIISITRNTIMEIKRRDGLDSLTKQLEAQILAAKKENMAYRIILGPNATAGGVAPRIKDMLRDELPGKSAIVKFNTLTKKLEHLWP